MRLLAIDPGLKGGVALFDDGRLLSVRRMPLYKAKLSLGGEARPLVDVLDLKNQLMRSSTARVVTEYQTPMPGQSSVATATSFLNWGLVLSLRTLAAVDIVHPRVWKGHWRLGNNKALAIAKAVELFPELGTNVLSDGEAEAILIGYYWLEKGSATAEAFARKAKPKPRRIRRVTSSSPSARPART